MEFIHEFSGDEENADALDFMRISYKRNVGDVVTIKNYVGLIQMNNGYQVQVLPKISFDSGEDAGNKETKNKAYDILRQALRKQCYLNQVNISLDQKIKEDTNMYYNGIQMTDSLEIHDIVIDKLMWEHIKNRISKVFGKDYIQIINLRTEGYTYQYIAKELGLSYSKVNFMFEKVKKWYTTIDS